MMPRYQNYLARSQSLQPLTNYRKIKIVDTLQKHTNKKTLAITDILDNNHFGH